MSPYHIRKAPKRDLYWVIGPDDKHYSKDPIPKQRAESQRRALYLSETKRGGAKEGKKAEDELSELISAFNRVEVAPRPVSPPRERVRATATAPPPLRRMRREDELQNRHRQQRTTSRSRERKPKEEEEKKESRGRGKRGGRKINILDRLKDTFDRYSLTAKEISKGTGVVGYDAIDFNKETPPKNMYIVRLHYNDKNIDKIVDYLNKHKDIFSMRQLKSIIEARKNYMDKINETRGTPIRSVQLSIYIKPNQEVYVTAGWTITTRLPDFKTEQYEHYMTQYGLGEFGNKEVDFDFKTESFKHHLVEQAHKDSYKEAEKIQKNKSPEQKKKEKEEEKAKYALQKQLRKQNKKRLDEIDLALYRGNYKTEEERRALINEERELRGEDPMDWGRI